LTKLLLGPLLLSGLLAQDQPATPITGPPPDVKTRTEWLERLHDEKARILAPQQLDKVENALNVFGTTEFLTRLAEYTYGFRPFFGGMRTGSGFAMGVGWQPPGLARKPYSFDFAAGLSTRGWQRYAAGVSFPRLWGDRLSLEARSLYRNENSISYFGPGDIQKDGGRTNFRREETGFDGAASIRPFGRYLRFGGFTGYRLYNVGPGQDRRYASASNQFPQPGLVPGLFEQTDYLRSGGEIEFDWRDFAPGPHRGGVYLARWISWNDRALGRYGFREVDASATQYFPFFNEKRVIVLRAATNLTFTDSRNQVPFYLQPTLGGSDDLRGFRPYRFYGSNRAVANAEYRWEVFSGMDGAFFFDAGQIFDRRSQFDFSEFETSWGFGLRGNVRNVPIIRVDVGFSREGFRVWFKFDNFM
jgi:outer membrane protein assembly factor BamA